MFPAVMHNCPVNHRLRVCIVGAALADCLAQRFILLALRSEEGVRTDGTETRNRTYLLRSGDYPGRDLLGYRRTGHSLQSTPRALWQPDQATAILPRL
ncbi:protein of unknown function [Nitrospira japonica]|uniref:Uncharacterized protein n=1 Tax=Nitrospira japonica TaxID=1325564 RepID=A0A1W1I1Y3_9BACT|nr:protein of unknown function [Nitrospira japonica]